MYRKIYSHANSIRVMMMMMMMMIQYTEDSYPCSADHERDWPPCKFNPFGT